MTITLAQLLTPSTPDESKQLVIDLLVSVGFSGAASWQVGSLPRTVAIELLAKLHSDFTQTIATVAGGGYNDTASGDWLALKSKSDFDNDVQEAVRTRGFLHLEASASAPTHVVAVGDLVARSTTGKTYRNLEGGTIAAGEEVDWLFEAEVAGIDGNAATGAIAELVTNLVGVTVTNEADWLDDDDAIEGADRETDVELRTRNRTKWATLSYAKPRDAYIYYAQQAEPSITRVFVDDTNPRGAGTLDLYIAGAAGTLSSGTATSVDEYLAGDTDGICRIPVGSRPLTIPATDKSVVLTGTIYTLPAYVDTVLASVNAAIQAYFKSLPVGGTVTSGSTGQVLLSGLYATVMAVPGVVNMAFTAPLANVSLALGEVAIPDLSDEFTVVEVT